MPADRRSLTLLSTYHDQLEQMARRVAVAVGQRFDALDRDDLGEALRLFVADASRVTSVGQEASASLTRGFFRVMAEYETGAPENAPPAPDNPGTTYDGRDLAEGFAATPAKMFLSLKQGRSLDEALRFGRFSAQRFAFTETMEAGRQELQFQMETSDKVRGWKWASRGTCGACLALDNGTTNPIDRPLRAHPNCMCIPEPVFNEPQLYERPTGRERFADMPASEQNAILGDKAELVRDGLIEWTALVEVVKHREWHDTVKEAALGALLVKAGLQTAEGAS